MPRTLSIQPLSLALGLAFGVLVLLSMSQVPVLNARDLNIQYIPDPRDMVPVKEGTPFTVPPGKLFVLTGLGAKNSSGGFFISLHVDGQVEVTTAIGSSNEAAPLVIPVPAGFTAVAGSVLDPRSSSPGAGRAWGYLAPQ